MSNAIERFREAASALGYTVPEVRRFPEGTKTAVDAARAIGCRVDQIVKSLVFLVGDQPVLALTSGANRVDPSKLGRVAGGARSRRASPDEAREATGFAVGGTPPFGHPERVRTFLDPRLLGFEEVWAAAGTHDGVFPIAPAELVRVAVAEIGDFTET